jgi:hypothetical protein
MIWIGLAEFGDVIGDRAAGLRGKISMAGVEEPAQRRLQGGPVVGMPARRRVRDVHVGSCHAVMSARSRFYVALGSAETGSVA